MSAPGFSHRRTSERNDGQTWPAHLHPGAVRFAHVSQHYEASVAFYRDLVGLPVVDEFTASFGEDGTIFGLPGTALQLEIVRARQEAPPPVFDQLILYLDSPDAVETATGPLRDAGFSPEPLLHPYWAANGAVLYRDPDGYDVVFAPWVYGRDPDPIDRDGAPSGSEAIRLDWYGGDREALRPLFTQAEDSQEQLDAYINEGQVLVAWLGARPVGHLQLVARANTTVELKNMAVDRNLRGRGIGRLLVETAISRSAMEGTKTMVVATAAADIGNLRFYQRCDFRFTCIERDAFTPGTGYPDPIIIDGIPLRDRVWLERILCISVDERTHMCSNPTKGTMVI